MRRRFKLENNIRRTSKTRGVNGGNLFFDETSGEFKKRPTNHDETEESAEIIARTRMRNFDTAGGDRAVNKVLKRRKKYKKLPVQVANRINEKEDAESKENEFAMLPPRKTKYKTSDTIRMHLRRTPDTNTDQTESSQEKLKQYDEHDMKDYKKPDRKRKHEKKVQKNVYDKQERNNNYEKPKRNQKYRNPERSSQFVKPITNNGDRKPQRNEITRLTKEHTPIKSRKDHRGRSDMPVKDEELKLESRQSTYEHYDSPEDVLLTSGYHNQISVQDPNYDFTIGKTNSISLSMNKL